MNRLVSFRLFLLAAAVLPGLPAPAQNPAPSTPPVTKISISAAAMEKPALTYVLLPEAQDIQPGNGAVKYGMAIDLYLSYRLNDQPDAHEDETLDKLNADPLSQLDVEAARKILDPMHSTFKLLGEGARCESCAWQLNIRQDGMATLLPYLAPMRAQTRRLQLAIRVDIKNHRWSDAQDKLQTGYAVARHLAEGQTLIETLVGAAIAIQMNECVKDWISEPGSPNLFWPLADLPHPIVPLGPGIAYERSLVFSEFPEWRSLMRGEGTPELLTNFLRHFFHVVNGVGGNAPSNGADDVFRTSQFFGVAMAIIDYPQAKQFLIARGATPEEVEKRGVASVVGEFFTRSFRETADDTFKWMLLPPEQAIPGLLQTEKEVSELPGDSMPHMLARTLMPTLSRAVVSTGKPDRQLAVFRIVEALRDYAAQHHALPDSLDQLSLPLSDDPTLGKPFTYEHRGDTAVLASPAPPLPGASDQIHYEITLQSQ